MKKVLLLTALIASAGYAEKIKFEYTDSSKNQSADIIGTAVIDVVTGDVKVSPSNDLFIVPNQPAVIGINADNYQVESGQSISVNWQVAYGENCIGTVENGSASGWSGSLSSGIGGHSKNVTVNNLPATLRITCDNYSGYTGAATTQKDLVISEVESTVVVDSDIIYFRANGLNNSAIISQPADVTISWNVSDASSCQATSSPSVSDWNQTFNPNSSSSKLVNIQETTTLTLTCGNDSKNVQVILDDSIPQGCNTSVYPEPNLNINSNTYAAIKDGNEFGTTTNGSVVHNILNTEFSSLKFTAPSSTTFRRRLNFIPAPTNAKKADKTTISISTCPGDFTATAACVVTVQSGDVWKISTDPSVGGSYCKINAGQEYYMNFVNKQDPYATSPPVCLNPSDFECAVFFSEGEL